MAEEEGAAARLQLTPYDLLGYLTPGGTMMLSTFAFEYLVNTAVLKEHGARQALRAPLLESATALLSKALESNSSAGVIAVAAVLLAIAYVVGHVIASIAALVIDRTLVYKGYGYPCSNLLRLKRSDDNEREFSRAFYRGLFFWLNLMLILSYAGLFITRFGSVLLLSMALGIAVLILLAALVKLLVSSRWSDQGWLRPLTMRRELLMTHIFAGIFDVFVQPLAKIMDTRRSFDEQFIALYRQLFSETFAIDVDSAGTNNFWLTYCYVTEESDHLRSLLSFWRTMYTFARNLSGAFYVAFLYCFLWLLVQLSAIREHASLFPFYLPLILLACSYVLLVRYYYLYVCYFNKFVLRAFVFAEQFRRRSETVVVGAAFHKD